MFGVHKPLIYGILLQQPEQTKTISMYRFLCGHKFCLCVNTRECHCWIICQECVQFCKNVPSFPPNQLYHFALQVRMNESLHCSMSSTTFVVFSVSDFGHSNGCVVVYHCFNLYFPEDVYVLFVICISSLVGCLCQVFGCFLIRWFIFILLNFESSSQTWDNSPLSDMFLANIFSKSMACLFILLT